MTIPKNEDLAKQHFKAGNSMMDAGQIGPAVESYRKAVATNPDFAEAHNNLGDALRELGKCEEAVKSLLRALEINPNLVEAHYNLGNALQDLERHDDAVASYRRALELRPNLAQAHNNMGVALRELLRTDEAVASYRRALELNPNYAEAHHNLGLCLLAMGRFSEGWPECEYRWEGSWLNLPRPSSILPLWRGETPAPGDGLLVFGEQGFGDRIQFSRYLNIAAKCFNGKVAVNVGQPLLGLFRRSFPNITVLENVPDDQCAWKWQCPMLSLPIAFNTTLETIPTATPYLFPDEAIKRRWKEKIAGLNLQPGALKIGIARRSYSNDKNVARRSLTVEQISPLLETPNCAWLSLQKEPFYDDEATPGKVFDWAEEFSDFDDTAALAANLDMVISTDTSVAHLAGALGLPTWLFNRHAGEWRWLVGRDDSPWYPTMKIFTQKTAGDWDGVVGRMSKELLAQKNQ